jgi:hypothetical protein
MSGGSQHNTNISHCHNHDHGYLHQTGDQGQGRSIWCVSLRLWGLNILNIVTNYADSQSLGCFIHVDEEDN